VPMGPEVEWTGAEIKAITYHGLEVRETAEGWEARYIVDV
jgi:SHS2 domain-containing protein